MTAVQPPRPETEIERFWTWVDDETPGAWPHQGGA
jgi:hypothetical protein